MKGWTLPKAAQTLAAILALAWVSPGSKVTAQTLAPKRSNVERFATLGSKSLSFVENCGQFDPKVKFQATSGNKVLWFTNAGLVFDVTRENLVFDTNKIHLSPSLRPMDIVPPGTPQRSILKSDKHPERLVFTEEFTGGNKTPDITPSLQQPGTYNYFPGNDPSKWRNARS